MLAHYIAKFVVPCENIPNFVAFRKRLEGTSLRK